VDIQRFTLGGPVTVVGRDGRPATLVLVGVLDLGANKRFSGLPVAALSTVDLHRLTTPDGYAEVVLTAEPGVRQADLAGRVSAALGGRYRVVTGDTLRIELARGAAKYVDGFLDVLLGFSLLALGVAGFVIGNTFTILVAQRTRELALLRCVGGSRRQLFGAVLAESAVVGVFASAGGLLLSLLVAYALLALRTAVGTGAPVRGLAFTPWTVSIALVVGTVTALAGALRPALLASRVPPVEALRGADQPKPGRRAGLAAVAVVAGAAVVVTGARHGFDGIPVVFGGALVLFTGVVVASPWFVPALTGAIGGLPARLPGVPARALLAVPARLATANARRNPVRVAATTSALVVGVALMSMVGVLLATAKDQARRELAENFPVDYVITGVYTGDGHDQALPLAVAASMRERPEVAAAAGCRVAGATVGGRAAHLWTAEPGSLTGPLRPEVMTGSLPDAHPGAVALNRFFAAAIHVAVGEPVPVTVQGVTRRLTLAATYDDAPVTGDVLLDWTDFAALFGTGDADQVIVKVAAGISPRASRDAVTAALRDHPLAQVSSQAEWLARLTGTLDQQLAILGALLGMSIVIGLFGIANTMALSVVARTRESALLRALGLSARQLRAMLLIEAGLMAVVAAVVGTGLGVAVGVAASFGAIRTYGHGLPVVPVGQLALYVGLAAVAGMVAALLPARRAARTPVTAALLDE
jgi:putative ABC transport system permease protein